MITTDYNTFSGTFGSSPREYVGLALGKFAEDYDIDAIVDDFVDELNEMISPLSLHGDNFYGPIGLDDSEDRVLEAVDSIDFWRICAIHELGDYGATLKVIREGLGLSIEEMSNTIGVSSRTIRNWESCKHPVPLGVRDELREILEFTDRFVGKLVEEGQTTAVAVVPRENPAYDPRKPETRFPASWHRMCLSRASREVRVRFEYA